MVNILCSDDVDVLLWCSLLFMFIEPNGPNYETTMKAHVVRPRPKPTSAPLLSNRHFLAFGGLPLGQSAYVYFGNIFRC